MSDKKRIIRKPIDEEPGMRIQYHPDDEHNDGIIRFLTPDWNRTKELGIRCITYTSRVSTSGKRYLTRAVIRLAHVKYNVANLVLKYFRGYILKKGEIAIHIDGDVTNNDPRNLKVGTRADLNREIVERRTQNRIANANTPPPPPPSNSAFDNEDFSI